MQSKYPMSMINLMCHINEYNGEKKMVANLRLPFWLSATLWTVMIIKHIIYDTQILILFLERSILEIKKYIITVVEMLARKVISNNDSLEFLDKALLSFFLS